MSELPEGDAAARISARSTAEAQASSAEEHASIIRIMDQALDLRETALEERVAALDEKEDKLRQRETATWLREHAQRLIDIAVTELEVHNSELITANEKLVMATLTAQELREAAQTASRRQDEFLAMLAHELRNPLAPISSAVELLSKLGAKPVPEQLLGMIRRQVQHMVRLLDDLLDASRLTEGKVALQSRRVAVAEFIQQAVETTRDLIAKKDQRLALDLPATPLYMAGDPARLVQIVSNLLQNSAKYTPRGGGISISARQEHDRIVLRVRDNGMGISAKALPHVFDLFVQDERALSRAEGGLGIGLTVVRRMVELHGGFVEAHSEGRDQGSEFVVTFPSAGRVDEAELSPMAVATLSPTPTSILVVEDSVDAGEALAQLLRMSGHDVEVALDGLEGLGRFDESRPRVVLCDIGLPGINGYEVAKRMRTRQHEPRTAIIAITGYGDAQASERAFAAGFDHYVVKPVNLEALLGLIHSALRADNGPASGRAS